MATEAIEVVGREEELEVILAFVGDVQSFPAALLLEGEAGIGKTTLWQAGIAAAVSSSFRVLVARPVEGETAFSFAALGDLLEGCLDEVVPVLPPPQCKALEVALSLTEPGGPPPDQRAVAMAFLGALRALAVSGPVLVAVDDVQWLDPPSAGIVRFAARRLRGESVGHLLAWRDEDEQQLLSRLDAAFPASPLRRIRVGPLSFGAVHRLLRDRLGTAFPRPTLQRIHEASGGNPFFALELGRALEARGKQLDPGESLPGVEELVRNRLDALPRETLTALSAAAALSQPTVALVSRAGRADSSKLEPAVRANVIELDGDRVRFTHPLLASAAYGTVDAEGRRELHGRLAEIVDDPEEKARHLARSATGADGTVAAALDKAARLAAARGANTAAAELAEQARELTPEHQLGNAVRRTLLAARHHFEAGDAARARALLEDAAASEADSSLRAEALTRLARAHVLADDVRLGADYYRQALVLAGPGDALRAEAEGGLALALFRMLEDLPEAAQHARAAAELSEKRGDRRMQADFLAEQSLVDALLGRRGATAVMRRAAALLEPSGRLAELPQSMFLRGTWGVSYLHALLLLWTDDPSGARSELEHTLERVRELGDEGSLPLILRHMSYIEWLAGHWTEAARLADEGYEVAQQMGQPIQQALLVATRAFVHAHCGLIDSARRDAEEGLALASDTGEMWAMVLSLAALGALELALENPGETHAHLGPIAERVEKAGVREPGAVVARFLPDEIEALIALDRLDHAERLLERLEQRAGVLDRVSALAAAGRCRGLLCAARGDLVGAGDAVDRALHEHGRLSMPFEKARTMLVLGSVQRRARDRRGARASFEQALALFETLGATLWARRTRAELGRIAGRPPATGGLTAAEQRVTELVAAGRTNKEVAAELVVAVRTVESTLTKVYAKLGVRSRTELSHRLRVSEPSKTT
jgi:DNA-binding CsgD family transcriptional regulator